MIDIKAVSEALDKCWKDYEERAYFIEHYGNEDMESWLRREFCKNLAEVANAGMARTYLNPDAVREGVLEKAPGLSVKDTADGFLVEGGGDRLGVSRTRRQKVSIHSEKSQIGWDATFWIPDDVAALIVAIARFDALNEPRMEKYNKDKDEASRMLINEPLRESSERSLEWEKEWEEKRKEAERKEAQVQALLDACAAEILSSTGRPCKIERKKPRMSSHFYAYNITLSSGQQMVFRDYSKEIGAIKPAIVATVPAIEALLPFSATKLSYAEGAFGMRYTDGWRKYEHKVFVERFKGEDTLLYLEAKLSSSKAAALLSLTERSIRMNVFCPRTSRKAMSFSLKQIESREDADALVAATLHLYLVRRKHPADISFA